MTADPTWNDLFAHWAPITFGLARHLTHVFHCPTCQIRFIERRDTPISPGTVGYFDGRFTPDRSVRAAPHRRSEDQHPRRRRRRHSDRRRRHRHHPRDRRRARTTNRYRMRTTRTNRAALIAAAASTEPVVIIDTHYRIAVHIHHGRVSIETEQLHLPTFELPRPAWIDRLTNTLATLHHLRGHR